jgi:hypothetical protein
MKRMVEFADKNNLEIVLAYYPPYHSKYNSIERSGGILENHWGWNAFKYRGNYAGMGGIHDLERTTSGGEATENRLPKGRKNR